MIRIAIVEDKIVYARQLEQYLLQCCRQLFFAFFLRFCQHIFVDGLAGFRVVACCIPTLPAAILTLADVTLAVCPFLSRDPSPP